MSKVLILSGGGARGAFQAGVYEQFMDEGWIPDAVAGISVGALNGAMIATHNADNMLRVWRDISEDQVLQKRSVTQSIKRQFVHWTGLQHLTGLSDPDLAMYSNEPLKQLLRENIGSRFRMTYYCGTVNIENGQYFEHKAASMMVPWSYINSIVASTAIPVVFDPVIINKKMHVDGGVRHMSPLGKILSDMNPTEIRIVICNKYRGRQVHDQGRPTNIVDVAKRTLSTMLEEIFIKDLRQFELINHFVRQGFPLKSPSGKTYKEYDALLYEPNQSLGDSLNFSATQARDNMAHGRTIKPIEL